MGLAHPRPDVAELESIPGHGHFVFPDCEALCEPEYGLQPGGDLLSDDALFINVVSNRCGEHRITVSLRDGSTLTRFKLGTLSRSWLNG